MMSFSSRSTSSSAISLPSLVTTVVWLVFAVAGVAGLRLQYQQAQARAKEKPPVVAEQMDVRMIGNAASELPRANSAPVQQQSAADAPPQAPSLEPVAEPSPEIPFAVPVNAPARRAQIASPVEHLTFGTGEGDKPPPEYPREAKIDHQQGTVTVQFTVNEEGHVTDTSAISPSAYPLLNQAAVRAVRDTWTFPHGKVRVYDVSFQFELHQK
jgi:TonB family protein